GESLPVEKRVSSERMRRGPDAPDLVFLGTSIVSGSGTAVVLATGPQTAFGDVVERLAARPDETEFERGTRRFGLLILRTVIFLVLFVFVVTAVGHRAPLEALLFAVALAVGLTPEFLPMITTVTLAEGAVRMARQKVIVKNLAALQNFGSIDVLCSDKTGTLTTGEMRLDAHVDVAGRPAERPLVLAYLNAYFESGVENAVDAALIAKSRIDPLDSAVLHHDHPDISGFEKVDEVPFDFERRRVSVVARRGDERLLVTKGAPEQMLAICSSVEVDGATRPLAPADVTQANETMRRLMADGYRVLAVAYAAVDDARAFTKDDEHDLTLAGFLAFMDLPRPDARAVLERLRAAEVEVKVLTGDGELVARHVCDRVGLPTGAILLGEEIERMTDPALAQQAERTSVFARVTPAQKDRILRALKSRGHVVGYLGDGINDAPPLHTADVGISVAGAVDVARDAADVILLERDLDVLLAGIVVGRKAFGNVMKYLLMGTSSNFGNMFSMAFAALLLPFLPMLPKQVLLNNFLYDLAQITIPTDNVDDAFAQKPRRWDIGVIRRFMLSIGPVSSVYDLLTFWVLLRVFHAPARLFQTGWFVESLATQTLVIFVIRSAGAGGSRPSVALTASTLAVVIAGVVLPFTPAASWLGFVPLPAGFFAFVVVATATYLALVELVKRRLFRGALT
ncbi:MAG TPA: magnesium-translocating P-type ATPase, partial [Minicystis sp.]|nr:magnesium-translocating P-type ATPase [Minicystis sp.]